MTAVPSTSYRDITGASENVTGADSCCSVTEHWEQPRFVNHNNVFLSDLCYTTLRHYTEGSTAFLTTLSSHQSTERKKTFDDCMQFLYIKQNYHL